MRARVPYLFLLVAMIALLLGGLFGVLSAIQYVDPGFLKAELPFNRLRPMHVSTVVSWILLSASGVVYYHLRSLGAATGGTGLAHFVLFLATGLLILGTLAAGVLGGREYMAFSPWFFFPILAGWILFAGAFVRGVRSRVARWPVFMWMWATGIAFLLFTFVEAQLWLLPWFRENAIREITVQWKSYGALVGSWNMLVYGTAIFVMHQIHGDDKTVHGRLPFFLFFVGLTNLMFGWAHHSYIVPAAPWIRSVAYAVSMTELLVLGIIIYNWRSSLRRAGSVDTMAGRLLTASDVWIFLNLILAIGISVPAVNFYTHGTHITVAHAMGTTIGINTTILLAAIYHIAGRSGLDPSVRLPRAGLLLFNLSLAVFCGSLIAEGLVRATWMYGSDTGHFRDMLSAARPWTIQFLISGIGLLTGLVLLCAPMLAVMRRFLLDPTPSGRGSKLQVRLHRTPQDPEAAHRGRRAQGLP